MTLHKKAEEAAEQLKKRWAGIYQSEGLWDEIAAALVAFAEAQVNETWDNPPPWFVRTEDYELARSAALDEAAKVVLGGDERMSRDYYAKRIRALKEAK